MSSDQPQIAGSRDHGGLHGSHDSHEGCSSEAATQDEEIEAVWRVYKADMSNKELRNRLVERYLPLVKYNGERIWARLPDGVELDDLISAGVFGLMDAIDAFDLESRRQVRNLLRAANSRRDAGRTANDGLGSPPGPLQGQQAGGSDQDARSPARAVRQPKTNWPSTWRLSLPELEKMILEANAVNLISLNKKWYETDSYKDVREIDILEDKKGEDPTRRIQKNDLMRLVTQGLNRNERLIIILYYYEELTMKEIGATLDLSESRVSQMHSSIVQRLQSQLGRRRPEFGHV